MPRKLQSPEQEIRFTRSGQAPLFWVASAVLVGVAVTMVACSLYREVNPELPHPAWACLPLLLAYGSARIAIRLTRHAYLILTPLGLEIFPFFKPSQNMQLVTWNEVHEAELNPNLTLLTLHHDATKTSGIRLSLKPIQAGIRPLLARAISGRIAKPATS
ncbi:MAG: hypothetical protein K9N23_09310 [Akkermansiaceae bacterium]|nr:hypothetical protein [Akkermansiaceae bacterium]MCF7731875.1 hypothetical protein [Akkermansiaceae bacterium]